MLHFETVSPTLLTIIRAVSGHPFFADFRLVGGTSLSLQLGHRMSIDADFFSNDPFEKEAAQQILAQLLPGFQVLRNSLHGFAAMYQGVKLDMYTWQVPFLLPAIEEHGMRLAALPDIAALKLEAISNRKEEKDIRDIHALLKRFSMGEMLQFFKERYPNFSTRVAADHLLAAPFVDRDLSIHVFSKEPWEEIVEFIIKSVTTHYEDLAKKRVAEAEENLRQRLQNIKKDKS